MTKKEFKNIIKESIREVLNEGLRSIIKEELANHKPIINNIISDSKSTSLVNTPTPKKKIDFNDFLPGPKRPKLTPQVKGQMLAETLKKNPLAAFIQDSAKNLTADEMQDLSKGIAVEEPMIVSKQIDYGDVDSYTPLNMPDFNR